MKNGDKTEHLNRTGMALSPELSAELVEATSTTQPSADGDARAIAEVRIMYAQQGEPVGSIPPPATAKATLKTMAKAITGKKMLVFVDKLGERLAFERSGTRLYDALLSKFDAYGTWDGGPSRPDLEEIRDEEHQHFMMLRSTIEEMGGDPTAVTPSANLHAVASKGLCAALSDPRTDLREGLEAILVAELVDNDCWENLSDLARALGQDELAVRFDGALEQERDHLRRVRQWLGVSLSRLATGGMAESFTARTEERERRMSATDSPEIEDEGSSRSQRRSGGAASRSAGATGRGQTASRSQRASSSRASAPARGKPRAAGTNKSAGRGGASAKASGNKRGGGSGGAKRAASGGAGKTRGKRQGKR